MKIEKEAGIAEDEKPFYIIYPDETASNWRIQAVSISPDSFENRLSLPEKWRGLRDEALSKESGDSRLHLHSQLRLHWGYE